MEYIAGEWTTQDCDRVHQEIGNCHGQAGHSRLKDGVGVPEEPKVEDSTGAEVESQRPSDLKSEGFSQRQAVDWVSGAQSETSEQTKPEKERSKDDGEENVGLALQAFEHGRLAHSTRRARELKRKRRSKSPIEVAAVR